MDLTNGGPNLPSAGQQGSDNVPQVKPIANNTGGGLPGGDGGSSQGARLGGGQRAGASSPGSPGFSTDIDQGFRSGGYTAGASGGAETPEGYGGQGGGGGGRGGAGAGRDPAALRIDLKQYLPGGRYDPVVLSGMQERARLGIHGPNVDLWERIHDRLIEKCKLGELYDCGM